MKTTLLKTEQGIALEIDGVVSDCKLDLTAVAEQIGELWGVFDVSYYKQEILKTAKAIFNGDAPDTDAAYIGGLTKGLDAMEKVFTEIINQEKRFTKADMEKAFEAGGNLGAEMFGSTHGQLGLKLNSPTFDETISSLRPDRVECTVEMETSAAPYPPIIVGELKTQIPKPKIVNGTIKVLTIKTT